MKGSLPQAARTKLNGLQSSAADADALAATALATRDRLLREIASLSQVRSTLTEDSTGRPFKDCEDRFKTLTEEIHRLEGEIEAVEEKAQRRRERAANDRQAFLQVNDWLRRVPKGVSFESVTTALPEVTDLVAAIQSSRDQLDRLKHQRRQMRGKELPPEDLKAMARTWVKQLASTVRPVLDGTRKGEFRFAFELPTSDNVRIRGLSLGQLAWLVPDILTKKIEEFIDETVPSEGAMPKAERDKQLAKLDDLILEIERSEERLIEEAQSRGLDVQRRMRADPRAILGIRIVTKKEAKKAA